MSETPGTGAMAVGGLVCVVGLAVTIGTMSAASSSSGGGSYVVAWGAILFGAFQFFRGLSEYSDYKNTPPTDRAFPTYTDEFRALACALVGGARDPNRITEAEARAINAVLTHAAKTGITEADLRSFAVAGSQEDGGVPGYLKAKAAALSPGLKNLIIRGCSYVMVSDGYRPDARRTLYAFGTALGMSRPEVREAAEFLENRAA